MTAYEEIEAGIKRLEADLNRFTDGLYKDVFRREINELKGKIGGAKPPKGVSDDGKACTRGHFDSLAPEQRLAFIRQGGKVADTIE